MLTRFWDLFRPKNKPKKLIETGFEIDRYANSLAGALRIETALSVEVALSMLVDQRLLADVAQTAIRKSVRAEAVRMLTDQRLLAEVARTATDEDVRVWAVMELCDQELLAKIAKTNKDKRVREAARMRFTEQQALAEIAKTGFTGREHSDRVLREAIKSNEDSRLVAVRLLGDQRMLAEVAKTATDEDVREAAVRRLRDQALLAEVAKTTHYLSAGREGLAAVKELNDQKLLAEIAETATSTTVREAAIKKLSDQRLLAEIAKAGKDKDPWLAGIAKTNNNSSVREAAVEKLSDQGVLAEVAKTDDSFFVREAAVDKLSDQGLLAEIAKTHTDRFLREAAARRSSDQGVLAQIARKTEDGDVGRKRLPIVQPASRSADNGPTSDLPDQQLLEKLQQLQKKHFQADPLTKGDSITELINNLIPKLAAVHGRDSARIFAVYHRSIGSPDLVILRACTSAEDLYHDLDALLEDYSVHVDDHYSVVADAENRIASIAVHNKGSASGRVMNVFVWREAKPLYRFIGQRGAFTDSTGLTVRRRGT